MELESGDGAEHNMSESLVNSPETKRLMEIAIASGAPVRTVHKTVRKRFRNRGTSTEGTGWWSRAGGCAGQFSQSGESGAAPAVWAVEESC